MRRSLVRVALLAAGLTLAAVLLIKAFVADVYLVDSASMEPALKAGERVLVLYRAPPPPPRRWDLVVVRLPNDPDPRVKRVAALGGELVQIAAGDLLVDNLRPALEGRPEPVLALDSAVTPLVEAFPGARWKGNVLDSRDEPQEACFAGRLTDAESGRPDSEGLRQVGDAVLEVEFELLALRAGASISLALSEQGDRFEARFKVDDRGWWSARLVREHQGASEQLVEWISNVSSPAIAGSRWRARLLNIDNHLQLELRGGEGAPIVLHKSYEANTPLEAAPDATATHRRPRACLAAQGMEVRVERLRLLRDVHYTDAGQWGTSTPLQLGPDEIYVLGDNSGASEDSRTWGALPLAAIIALPVAVVWPPSSWRRL